MTDSSVRRHSPARNNLNILRSTCAPTSTRWAKRSGSRLQEKRHLPAVAWTEIHRAQQSNVLPVEQLKAAHVPHRLKSLLESMLAFEPASRPGTGELAARLQRCSPEARSVRRTRAALALATARRSRHVCTFRLSTTVDSKCAFEPCAGQKHCRPSVRKPER